MATVQQFRLRWNNHQPNFITMFTKLLTSEELVDVTLGAEGQNLQAHKVVLSACSTYFQVSKQQHHIHIKVYIQAVYVILEYSCFPDTL